MTTPMVRATALMVVAAGSAHVQPPHGAERLHERRHSGQHDQRKPFEHVMGSVRQQPIGHAGRLHFRGAGPDFDVFVGHIIFDSLEGTQEPRNRAPIGVQGS